MTQLPKYMQEELENKKLRVLIEFQKHGTIYRNATSKEYLLYLALLILKSRVDIGYFRTVKEIQDELDKLKEPITEKEFLEIPKCLVNEAIRIRRNHQMYRKDLVEELRHSLMAEKAIENNDGVLAWLLLEERQDYENEKIELHTLL